MMKVAFSQKDQLGIGCGEMEKMDFRAFCSEI